MTMTTGKVLLITGGTGSFGHVMLRHALSCDFAEIRIFSRDENKQDLMRKTYPDARLRFLIGDVRDPTAVRDALRGVDFVFHAAALKQVPSCEFYPMEAVKTNIIGADNVLRAALECGVSRCVVLSTDKAVYPINAMGLSKAMMEKAMIAASRLPSPAQTVLCATRYGNVMDSRGSVIPLFLQQIAEGKPITVTDPDMTRFMMSLDESVALVMHAFAHAQPGDIFVQKAPAATVGDLAEAIRRLVNPAHPIQIIGPRHGEKAHESLVSREEMARAEEHGLYYRVPADGRDLNYEKYLVQGEHKIAAHDDYTSANARRLSVDEICELLLRLDSVRRVAA